MVKNDSLISHEPKIKATDYLAPGDGITKIWSSLGISYFTKYQNVLGKLLLYKYHQRWPKFGTISLVKCPILYIQYLGIRFHIHIFWFLSKKNIAPAFQPTQHWRAQFRMTRRRSMCYYTIQHIYFWANEKGRGERAALLFRVRHWFLCSTQQFCAIRPLKSVRRLLLCSRNTSATSTEKRSQRNRGRHLFRDSLKYIFVSMSNSNG